MVVPKAKLGLPTATMTLVKSLNQSPQGGFKKKWYTSRNGPTGNCCKLPNKYLIGYVLGKQNGGSTISTFWLVKLKCRVCIGHMKYQKEKK